MLGMLKDTEIEYIKCFSKFIDDEDVIRFWDDNIPDMYDHNFIFLKDNVHREKVYDIITDELKLRENGNKGFMKVVSNFQVDDEIIHRLHICPIPSQYDFMYISPDKSDSVKGNSESKVLEASSDRVLKDGAHVSIQANVLMVGNDFAKRSIDRRIKVYSDPLKALRLFVCYYKDIPVGKCELFFNNRIAKIEDFEVLDEYQRMGFGTSIIKYLLKESKDAGMEIVYVITDHDDTAKVMYAKCGFTGITQKYELFFRI